MAKRRAVGNVRRFPSGRWQARYLDPDGERVEYGAPLTDEHGEILRDAAGKPVRRTRPRWKAAPVTFDTKMDAGAWLDARSWERPSTHVHGVTAGAWQALYRLEADPPGVFHEAPRTFATFLDARAWLDGRGWEAPASPADLAAVPDPVLCDYAEAWLAQRDLKPRTRAHYRRLLDREVYPRLSPALGDRRLSEITSAVVRTWNADLDPAKPTLRAHAYSLLRTIMLAAVDDEGTTVAANPCRIDNAGRVKRAREIDVATPAELAAIVAAMPEEWRALVVLAAWCALRLGEVTALQRGDVDVATGVLHVRRAVVRVPGRPVDPNAQPKSSSGRREVVIPPHVLPVIVDHLDRFVGPARADLLFSGRNGKPIAPSTLQGAWNTARIAAGRPTLRFHDLRHTGSTLAAEAGATLPELMLRLGHSTAAAAMVYQQRAKGRDREIAERMSAAATGSGS